jgi:hypothetical protein
MHRWLTLRSEAQFHSPLLLRERDPKAIAGSR